MIKKYGLLIFSVIFFLGVLVSYFLVITPMRSEKLKYEKKIEMAKKEESKINKENASKKEAKDNAIMIFSSKDTKKVSEYFDKFQDNMFIPGSDAESTFNQNKLAKTVKETLSEDVAIAELIESDSINMRANASIVVPMKDEGKTGKYTVVLPYEIEKLDNGRVGVFLECKLKKGQVKDINVKGMEYLKKYYHVQ